MTESELDNLQAFVTPFYEGKDLFHGIDHINRMLRIAFEIIDLENLSVDADRLVYAAFLHGACTTDVQKIEEYIYTNNLAKHILVIALESLGKSDAATIEGRVLSDAHFLEGGRYFRYLKPLLTGTYMHQSLEDTFSFIENSVLGRGKVYFEYTRIRMNEMNTFINALHTEFRGEISNTMRREELLELTGT